MMIQQLLQLLYLLELRHSTEALNQSSSAELDSQAELSEIEDEQPQNDTFQKTYKAVGFESC